MQPLSSALAPTLPLKTTKQGMPCVGLGTWKIPKELCNNVVYDAIRMGYRLFDCACDYGNEVEVGAGIQRAIQDGLVTRKELFVVSKLWCTFMEPEHVEEACRKTLTDLGCGYLDLYLIHFPIPLKYVSPSVRYPPGWAYTQESGLVYSKATIQETWQAMEKLVDADLVKNIGVANFNCALLMDMMRYARIPPTVNQIEMHPYLYHDGLVNYCHKNDMQIIAFHSFGGQSLIELGNETAIETPALLEHEVVSKIASKYGKSNAQILLRWALERGAAIIPKSSKAERLAENMAVCQFQLDNEDMVDLAKLDKKLHFNDPKDFADTPIWD